MDSNLSPLQQTSNSSLKNIIDNIEDNSDIDIYSDLECNITSSKDDNTKTSSFEDDLLDELQVYGKLHKLEKEVSKLREQNQELHRENEDLYKQISMKDRQIQVLKANISSLYKTAKMELDRRQREQQELQSQYDALVFRRIQYSTQINQHQSFDESNNNVKLIIKSGTEDNQLEVSNQVNIEKKEEISGKHRSNNRESIKKLKESQDFTREQGRNDRVKKSEQSSWTMSKFENHHNEKRTSHYQNLNLHSHHRNYCS